MSKAQKPAKVQKEAEKVVQKEVEATEKVEVGVKVKNVRKTYFRQESTGTFIGAGETKVLANDSWLQNQIRAGLLEKV